jgi:hypothetical protein
MSVREDFISAYQMAWNCPKEYADGLLRHVEITAADTINADVNAELNDAAARQMVLVAKLRQLTGILEALANHDDTAPRKRPGLRLALETVERMFEEELPGRSVPKRAEHVRTLIADLLNLLERMGEDPTPVSGIVCNPQITCTTGAIKRVADPGEWIAETG